MRGRGTRKADHIHKSNFTMFDFVGVTDFHGDDETPGEGGFVVVRKKKKDTTSRKLLVLDVNDHIDPASRDWVTLDDDGNFVQEPAVEARANSLALKFEAWLPGGLRRS